MCAIRDMSPADGPHVQGFIAGLQDYEAQFEPDRLPGDEIAETHLKWIMREVADKNGRLLVAEKDGALAGFVAGYVLDGPAFVRGDERRYGYVCDIFVREQDRGSGVFEALMGGMESHFRALGLGVMRIGVHSRNPRARRAYERYGFADYDIEMRRYIT